ncbi:hypothetical protein B0H11DRAFT_2332351 [Mycena galericulata]|nr:hypothetical protein B0H11DRAFT_2332351 [Mycena galericulata]
MEMPRLKTRAKNKETRPGVKAGVERKTRPTAAEREEKLAAEKAAVEKEKAAAKKAMNQVAALEDKQRQDDIAYAKTANHPTDRSAPDTPAATAGVATEGRSEARDSDPGSGDDSEPYQPGDDESGEDSEPEGESSDDESDEDEDTGSRKKQKKKKRATRADIVSHRKTQDSTGTPAVTEDKNKKRKAADKPAKSAANKKAKPTPKKKGGLNNVKSKLAREDPAPRADNDLMVALGGPALDNDGEEGIERPKTGKKAKGRPAAPAVVIQAAPPKPLTRKEIRGGSAKWTLKHLPAGTSDEFTSEVVPLTRELAGSLAPWDGLTVKQIQDIVDKVYGVGKHEVAAESAWVGLVGYRLHDWRGILAAQARKAIDALIASSTDSDEDSDVEVSDAPPVKSPAVTTPASGTAADAGSAVADAVSATAAIVDDAVSATAPIADDTVPNIDLDVADVVPDAVPDAAVAWDFKTRTGIAAFVKWALQVHTDSGTNAFHWKTWGDGKDKQGFFQSHLIVYTFAYHLSCLVTIPGSYERLTARPIGALLLSAQAVERTLQFWRTGEYVNPGSSSSYFSGDVWGDTTVIGKKGKRLRVRRATKFMATIEKWDEDRWTEVIAAAEEWMELPSCKRSATTSRSASEAEDEVMSDDDVVMVLSD